MNKIKPFDDRQEPKQPEIILGMDERPIRRPVHGAGFVIAIAAAVGFWVMVYGIACLALALLDK